MKDRNNDIVSRLNAGETLKSIGDRYGVSRERIRQIGNSHGITGRGKMMVFIEALRNMMDNEKYTQKDIMSALDIDSDALKYYCKRHKIINRFSTDHVKRRNDLVKQLNTLIDVCGLTHQEVANRLGVTLNMVAYWCKKLNIVSARDQLNPRLTPPCNTKS